MHTIYQVQIHAPIVMTASESHVARHYGESRACCVDCDHGVIARVSYCITGRFCWNSLHAHALLDRIHRPSSSVNGLLYLFLSCITYPMNLHSSINSLLSLFLPALLYRLKLKVNKLTSIHSLYPRDYYSLPFCRPTKIQVEGENLGEFLAGDKIENSPYTNLYMRRDVYCQELCTANLGRGEHRGTSPSKVVAAIRQEYHNNWIVDGLNAAYKTEDDETIMTNFREGFPIGFIPDDNLKAYSTLRFCWHCVVPLW
jgi:Endomembrane protein 70